MAVPLYLIDAFTATAFAGNPAAVVLLDAAAPAPWMQQVAAEMRCPETAFLVSRGDDGEAFDLRWFTPTVEVDLCGHATLASAHALWQSGRLPAHSAARFHTRSGLLTAARRGALIELDFPAEVAAPVAAPDELMAALGARVLAVARNRLDYLVEVESAELLRSLRPDFPLLATIETRGVIVTCRSDDRRYDFCSRFFAPRTGIDEDPVTGSAHCGLAPFWAKRLGKTAFTAYQASPRGGVVHARLAGERVILGGQAVTVVEGQLV